MEITSLPSLRNFQSATPVSLDLKKTKETRSAGSSPLAFGWTGSPQPLRGHGRRADRPVERIRNGNGKGEIACDTMTWIAPSGISFRLTPKRTGSFDERTS